MTITAGADGNLWFVDPTINFSIGRMTPTGEITEFPMITQGTSGFGITAGPDGNVWYSVLTAGKLGRVTPSGQVTEYPIPTPYSLVYRLTAGPDGNIWFAENGATANKIGYIVP